MCYKYQWDFLSLVSDYASFSYPPTPNLEEESVGVPTQYLVPFHW